MPDLISTMDLVKQAHANPKAFDAIAKSFAQSTGLVAYDLEAPAKKIVPVITPLRNMCPRVKSNGGDTATRWKAITAINTGNVHPGVTEGNRGAVIADAVTDLTASYIGIGLENSVSFEADYAAESFDDAKARAVENLLYSAILKEEDMLLGGNSSVALGTTPTPTGTAVAGGSMAGATLKVICVALTYDGYRRSSLSGGVVQQISRTNADGTSDTINGGAAQKSSASADVTTATTNLSVQCTVTAVKGAVGYAWFIGASGAERLQAITTTNTYTRTAALESATQLASALASADYSRQNGYSYDGFLYTAFNTSGAGYTALGATLTADGKGGVVEINNILGAYWDNLQLQPDAIWANRQQVNDITTKCVGSATSPFRFNVNGGQAQGSLVGGGKVTEYQSPVDSSIIPIHVHPKIPAGTMLFTCQKLPYALNNVGDTFRIKARREWYQVEWPLRTRKYEYGIYSDCVFQHYFPVSLSVLTNIYAG